MLFVPSASQLPPSISSATGLYTAILKSQNHSHTKFSRRLLCHFFKSSALRELCPYQKSLEQLRVCAQDGLKSSPSWGVTHCSACILPTAALHHCFKWPNCSSQSVSILHLLFLGANSKELGLPSLPVFIRLQQTGQRFAPCFTPETTSLPQVHSSVTEHSTWQRAQNLTQQVYGVWRWY